MSDRLSDEERILAWKASWHPSFDGVAIVNPDFTFRSVNPQFCKLLGVTPAELIGQRFQDITPPSIRKLDSENAELVKNDEGECEPEATIRKFRIVQTEGKRQVAK